MSALATLFHVIHHERTPSRRRLLATGSHATTAGLLSMMIDSSVTLAPTSDLVLTAILFAVCLCFCGVLLARAWIAPEASGVVAPLRASGAYLRSPDGLIDIVAVLALSAGWRRPLSDDRVLVGPTLCRPCSDRRTVGADVVSAV